jgi:AmmeMemoRadiSam system protein B
MAREPLVAGQFYPSDAEELKKQVSSFLEKQNKFSDAPAKALIAPHAGYTYSGRCAASAYKQLGENAVFLILGVNHSGIGKTSLSLKDFKTPLGTAKNEIILTRKLKELGIEVNEEAQDAEHSIEVQLPFLQVLFDKIEFVPLIVGSDYKKYISGIARVLQGYSKKVCIIASSDMTHYGLNYYYLPFTEKVKENLYELDRKALEFIEKIDADGFNSYIDKTGATICGRYTISLLLELMELQKSKAKLIEYYTSGDIARNYSSAVGYASIAFY